MAGVNSTSAPDFITNFPLPSDDDASDAIWILSSTFLIFTMQSGFGLLESGSVSLKNEVNIMMKNVVDVIFGGLSYWMVGYAFSFGRDEKMRNGFCGWGQFFAHAEPGETGLIYSHFFFQSSFATTATTIVSGSMAERCKMEAYVVFSVLNTFIYCFPAHWVWDEAGWLFTMGLVDVAGAGPVHVLGGVTSLVSTMMLKPRYGRYSKDQCVNKMGTPINALLGMFMLWWGWMGFNCGSTYGISGYKWKLAARAAMATLVSSVAGGIYGITFSYFVHQKMFDISLITNAVLGALVSSTAYCAVIEPWESFVVGLVGAMLALAGIRLMDLLHIDDPVGCVGVHAFAGVWSLISVGLFAKKDAIKLYTGITQQSYGLFYGGGFHLLGVQTLACVVIATWTCLTSYVTLKLIDVTIGLRVSREHEIIGADIVEHNLGMIGFDKQHNRVMPISESFNESLGQDSNLKRVRKVVYDQHKLKEKKLMTILNYWSGQTIEVNGINTTCDNNEEDEIREEIIAAWQEPSTSNHHVNTLVSSSGNDLPQKDRSKEKVLGNDSSLQMRM